MDFEQWYLENVGKEIQDALRKKFPPKIDPLGDNISSIELIDYMGDDRSIVNAARVSFGKTVDKFEPKDEKLIKYLWDHDHGSPFEHNSMTFRVKCPLFVRAQWMRHRIASYNEISARYVEVKEEYYVPWEFRAQSDSNRQASTDKAVYGVRKDYVIQIEQAIDVYRKLIDAGLCREQARAVLPQAMYTEFLFTVNLRSLLNFLKLRDHEGAQWEIRQYAKAIKELIKDIFPVTMSVIL